MRHHLNFWMVAALLLLVTTPFAAAQPAAMTPLPIESIARLPAVTGVVLSPDGRHLAGLVARQGQRWPVVAIWTVDDLSRPPVLIPSQEMRPRSVSFLGNNRVLFFVDQPITYGARRDFTVEAVVADLDGRNFSQPLGGGLGGGRSESERVAGLNFSVLRPGTLENPNEYIIARFNTDDFSSEILSLDSETMRVTRVARAGDDQSYLIADARDGRLMVRETVRSEGGAWRVIREVRNRASGNWEEHPELSYSVRERRSIDPIGFYDTNPNHLYVSTARATNFRTIRIYNIATRAWDPEPAFASADFDIVNVNPEINYATRQILGLRSYVIEGSARREVFVDQTWSAIQRTLETRFSGQNVHIAPARLRDGFAVITVEGPSHPPSYFLLQNGRELRLIGHSMPWVDRATLGQTSFVNYRARDGMTIPAFLTLPPGYNRGSSGRVPAIVLPHGGPWARDYLDWDQSGWPQFLATRGYAVIQPQYRGSDGWGMALWTAGDGQWGQRMSDDNDDAAAWLVSEGIADQQRLGIFGYSYGGFAAIAASVRPNSPYRCALSGAGVSDLERLGNLWGANRIQRQAQGWTVTGMNPIANVRNANIPILLYHGSHDRQADTVHSRDFYRAMRGAGKQVEYHEIETMWHQLPWWPEWHRESLGYIESWFAGPSCFGGARQAAAN